MSDIAVIGAGLAGCEAAHTLSRRGKKVALYEMKPIRRSPAHRSDGFAELVCSNSLKAKRVETAAGLLKQEMRMLGSLTLECAARCEVPAGGALAVDREIFSRLVTEAIQNDPNIEIRHEEITALDLGIPTIVATGPLTDGGLADSLSELTGGFLSFFDAAAPIVTADSIDMSRVFAASRYDRGDDDYLNCFFSKEEYERFYNELINAETAPVHGVDSGVYEGCMPIERLAKRGEQTMRFGPMKPVGLRDPRTGHRPWAAVQLRKENTESTMYNIVGFQTSLKFGEQKRVFSMIPGLEEAEFARYGVMHRNSFLNAPKTLNPNLSLKNRPEIFVAGQLTGFEGYMESASSGILAARFAVDMLDGIESRQLPEHTMLGSLLRYIGTENADFQPMGANMGVIPPLDEEIRDKKERYAAVSRRAIDEMERFLKQGENE